MSVVFSKLKRAKSISAAYLKDKYKGYSCDLFYSLGTEDKNFTDQFLKVETELGSAHHDNIESKLREFLCDIDAEYSKIDIKVVSKR